MAAAKIDAHHHLWQYNARDYVWMSAEMDALRRDFLPADLEAVLGASGIAGAVTVQARQTVEETRWLLEVARKSKIIRGVVGWVPLTDPDVGRHLDEFAADAKLKGVRHVLHDEADDDYMLRADFNQGITLLRQCGLAYDLLIFERHLPQATEFVDRHPNQVFIVDHIAKPRIGAGEMSPWRERISELARRENVFCKVSGMVTEAGWKTWSAGQLEPFFDVVLGAFGPRRLMFGSDWPVLTLASSYAAWAETAGGWLARLAADERESMWGGTATRAYGLR